MENEIVVSDAAAQFLPVMSMAVAVQRRSAIVEFTKQIMVKDTDFGAIPGTGGKPSLLKPGAEKLCSFFGLSPVFVPIETIQDWMGKDHDGEAFFLYRYRCELYRNGSMVGTGIGSCNSWESKYRYRKADRTCPHCGNSAIIKGKAEYGGGWVCFKAKGGCGAKFTDNDPAITNQPTGKVANPDPADIVNTIDKMAQKRALVAATLISVNASEFFTQDIEDTASGYVDATYTVMPPEPPAQTNGNERPAAPKPTAQPADIPPEVAGWEKAEDAYEWAVGIQASDNVHAARNAMTKIVEAHGGKFTKQNATAIYVAYYHDRMARAQEKAKAALEAMDMADVQESDPDGVFA